MKADRDPQRVGGAAPHAPCREGAPSRPSMVGLGGRGLPAGGVGGGAPHALGIAICLLLAAAAASAQDAILASYERNFARAGLATKTGVLRDAATDERAADFMGALYDFSLRYALENGELLRDDPDMIALVELSAQGAGAAGHIASIDTLWKLFAIYRDTRSRVEILRALGALAGSSPLMIENLNQFLANQNSYFRSGMAADYPTVLACVQALAALGDPSSYPVLFSALTAGYSDALSAAAAAALEALHGDYQKFLLDVLRGDKTTPVEKLAAFNLGARNERFTEERRAELAEAALERGLEIVPGRIALSGDGAAATLASYANLRYAAARVLTDLRWTRASALAIRHFYQAQADYAEGGAPKERFLEAVACLGAMGDTESAKVLAIQLGYANSQTERNGEYDEEIVLAFINAIGEIGDKVAFDYLLYISYLSYPEPVQAAARDALNRLRW